MRTWDEVIKQALFMYVHRDQYAYFYGAKGEVLTEGNMESLIRAYPDHFNKYSPEEISIIKNWSRGKIGFDCSGFISYCSGAWGNSAQLISDCYNKSNDLVKGVAGSFLYKPGHIGLDVGYGMFVDCPTEGQSIRFGKILEYNWTTTGQSKYINYEGANNR